LFLSTALNSTNAYVAFSRPNRANRSARLSGSAQDRISRWFDTTVFTQPAQFTFGNTSRTLSDVRDQGTNNLDAGFFKNNLFGHDERYNLQFRAELFNLANRVRFGDPGMVLNTPLFGVISSQINSPRQIQLALKLIF